MADWFDVTNLERLGPKPVALRARNWFLFHPWLYEGTKSLAFVLSQAVVELPVRALGLESFELLDDAMQATQAVEHQVLELAADVGDRVFRHLMAPDPTATRAVCVAPAPGSFAGFFAYLARADSPDSAGAAWRWDATAPPLPFFSPDAAALTAYLQAVFAVPVQSMPTSAPDVPAAWAAFLHARAQRQALQTLTYLDGSPWLPEHPEPFSRLLVAERRRLLAITDGPTVVRAEVRATNEPFTVIIPALAPTGPVCLFPDRVGPASPGIWIMTENPHKAPRFPTESAARDCAAQVRRALSLPPGLPDPTRLPAWLQHRLSHRSFFDPVPRLGWSDPLPGTLPLPPGADAALVGLPNRGLVVVRSESPESVVVLSLRDGQSGKVQAVTGARPADLAPVLRQVDLVWAHRPALALDPKTHNALDAFLEELDPTPSQASHPPRVVSPRPS